MMGKEITYFYSALLLIAPFFASFLGLGAGKKFGLFVIHRRFVLYIIVLGFVYYGSFFFGEYVIPNLNSQLYSMHAKAMGIVGLLQDFIIPVAVAIPAFLGVNKIFNVNFGSGQKTALSFLLYYSCNFVMFLSAMSPFSDPTY